MYKILLCLLNKSINIVMHRKDSYPCEFVGTTGALHSHLEISSLNAWFATWSAKVRLLTTVLSINFPKVGIGIGSKIETTFLF
jgi:hypothetical protein